MPPCLTLGPLFFHWPAEKRRDFYFRIADEADVDVVYLGEVVCSKREPFFEPHMTKVVERLKKAKKEIALSTLALVTTPREIKAIKEKAKGRIPIEANDVAAVQALGHKPFVVGPFINVFNEGARDYLIRRGATRFVLPIEMTMPAIRKLLETGKNVETEVQVFGRLPLAVSMRCYAARAYGLKKDGCHFSCSRDTDGLCAETIDGMELLAVNGTQILSHGYGVYLREMKSLRQAGVSHFRLSPQSVDMVKVAALYRDVLNGKKEPLAAEKALRKLCGSAPFINGFLNGTEGLRWSKNA